MNVDPQVLRLAALRRFGAAITVLTLVGHVWLGFEQSYAYVAVALATAYGLELILETLDAWSQDRTPAYRNVTLAGLVDFLLPAHITALACAMLLYSNERLWPIAFAVAVAMGSKSMLQVTVRGRSKHFLNPSNTGIVATLLVFPWVSIAPPYQFTENLAGGWDWALPLLFVCVGTFLNARFTMKIPLIAGWLGGFVLQAVVRSTVFDSPLLPALSPMTGVAFLLFTFYMVTDPATTPFGRRQQFTFGGQCSGGIRCAHDASRCIWSVPCSVRGVHGSRQLHLSP